MRTAIFLAATILSLMALPAAGETAEELWRLGYKVTWESSYEDVEECTPENGVVLSDEIIFICDGYEYVYHYGAVFIASRTLTFQGRTVTINFLCMEGEDECLSGTVVHK